MQIRGLHKNIYRLYAYARTQETLEIYRKEIEGPVRQWRELKAEGVCDKTCQSVVGISRATYFRYCRKLDSFAQGIHPPSKRPLNLNKPQWGEAEVQLVLRLRRENPTYGKEKIHILLKRDFKKTLSASTVGRILKHLMNRGLCPTSLSAPRYIKRRSFERGHAKRCPFKNYDKMHMGEQVQIDHMTVYKNSMPFKHFQAWDRKSKFIYANVYSSAKSVTAKAFLEELIKNTPFKIHSIQVDGGSEFMAHFEEECKNLNIPLFVLPPRKPQYNGGVERANRTFREEFYARKNLLADSISSMQQELSKAVEKYNTYRPHFSLNGLTPMQYISNHLINAVA